MNNFSIFLVLITIVCLLLIIVIMVQNPKGGGLSSALGGSQMMGGVQKTTDFLDKSTWTLGGLLMALILLSAMSFPGMLGSDDSKILKNTAPMTVPAAPAPTQDAQTAPATDAAAETPAQN